MKSEPKKLPTWAKDSPKPTKVTAYMDGTDLLCELDGCPSGTTLYPSQDDVEADRECLDACGVVEVEVTLVRWVRPGTLWTGDDAK